METKEDFKPPKSIEVKRSGEYVIFEIDDKNFICPITIAKEHNIIENIKTTTREIEPPKEFYKKFSLSYGYNKLIIIDDMEDLKEIPNVEFTTTEFLLFFNKNYDFNHKYKDFYTELFTQNEFMKFNNCIFADEISIDFLSKKINVQATNILFLKSVNFKRCIFETSNFNFSRFYGFATFEEATFNDERNFKGAIFYNTANFKKANFPNKANFRITKFHSTANFEEAIFSKEAEFTLAQFSKEAGFSKAQFSNIANFTEATFEKTIFDKATFKNKAIFLDLIGKNIDIDFEISEIHSLFLSAKNPIKKLNFNLAIVDKGVSIAEDTIVEKANVATYVFLKHQAIEQNNRILAWRFHSKEMNQRLEELTSNPKAGEKENWFILQFNRCTNNHGSNALLAFVWIVVIFLFGIAFESFFFEYDDTHNIAWFISNYASLEIAKSLDFDSPTVSFFYFVCHTIFKVGIIVCIWQFIQALRRYTRMP